MAQTDQNMLGMSVGIEHGSNNKCQRCGGMLRAVTGTDVDDVDEKGGYREEYECIRCHREGTYWYSFKSHSAKYHGVCADYDY